MIKVIENVLTKEDSFTLYSSLINANIWHLNRFSNQKDIGGAFPGVNLIEDNEVFYNNPYWIGYFEALFNNINQKLTEQHNFSLRNSINRIALNAANDNHYTEFHSDMKNESTYSIVGFLTPQWSEEWGGSLNVEGEDIKYEPGSFVLFNSNQLHKSNPIKKIPYWRVSINYVINK